MCKSRFHPFFRKQTGMTFVAYINKVRVEHAARLLVGTDLSLKFIAYDCGFDSISQFFKRFKEHYGVTPGRFRDLY